MARVILYSQQPILSKGFSVVLSAAADLELVCICAALRQLSDILSLTEPQLLVLDWDSDIGFDSLLDIRKRHPACRILLWVNSIPAGLAYQSMRLGVHGLMRKTLPADVALNCLRKVAASEYWFEETPSAPETGRLRLTARETELIALLARGLRNKEIAAALSISEGTVKVYLSKLFRKVGVKDRYELALHGLKDTAHTRARAAGKHAASAC